jgi:pimeloyl-ACP methyl ester carboxylesterase
MPFAKVNGTQLYYEVHGQGAPVVLVHGGASNHISWYRQVVALRDHYTVVTYDQRGFGFSEENGDYEASAVEDLRELLDHLGYQKVALLGQSLGGAVVAGFTSRYPGRVRALVLSSTPAGLVDTGRTAPPADQPQPPYAEMVKGMIGQDDFAKRSPATHFLVEQLIGINTRVSSQRLNGTFYARNDRAHRPCGDPRAAGQRRRRPARHHRPHGKDQVADPRLQARHRARRRPPRLHRELRSLQP